MKTLLRNASLRFRTHQHSTEALKPDAILPTTQLDEVRKHITANLPQYL